MNRPYIICHMLTSIDGKVTGDFLSKEASQKGCEIYYEKNRKYDADCFICGRVTMQESFTGSYYPDLSGFSNSRIELVDFINKSNRLVCAMALGEMAEPRYERSRKDLEEILCIINN